MLVSRIAEADSKLSSIPETIRFWMRATVTTSSNISYFTVKFPFFLAVNVVLFTNVISISHFIVVTCICCRRHIVAVCLITTILTFPAFSYACLLYSVLFKFKSFRFPLARLVLTPLTDSSGTISGFFRMSNYDVIQSLSLSHRASSSGAIEEEFCQEFQSPWKASFSQTGDPYPLAASWRALLTSQ